MRTNMSAHTPATINTVSKTAQYMSIIYSINQLIVNLLTEITTVGSIGYT